jgi:hypothetical protein
LGSSSTEGEVVPLKKRDRTHETNQEAFVTDGDHEDDVDDDEEEDQDEAGEGSNSLALYSY